MLYTYLIFDSDIKEKKERKKMKYLLVHSANTSMYLRSCIFRISKELDLNAC